MSHIFISYSRKDIDVAGKIVDALAKNELETWIDWKSIPKGEDWEREIYQDIEEADAFLFLISPDSAKSEMCNKEIAHAIRNNKRVLPIVISDTNTATFLYEAAKNETYKRNWIFCRTGYDDFNKAIKDIQTTIQTDYVWLKRHTRLQVKALEWERNRKENSFLLRGKDLQDAEFQLATNSSKEPYPTTLQSEYIITSRRTEDMQRRTSRLRRNIAAIIAIALLITIVFAQMGYFNRFIYRPVDIQNYWVTIPAGEFQMGNSDEEIANALKICPDCNLSDEKPQHAVYLDAYQIGKYEITNRQYIQCMSAGVCGGAPDVGEEKALHPAMNVTWYDAKTFCEWVGGCLPTEAEWEKAASWDPETETKFAYPWGNDDPTLALLNYNRNVDDTSPVGSYPDRANPYGLFDMAGNVWEWVNDWYDESYYQISPSSNPLGPDSGQRRAVRGGAWHVSDNDVRSANRDWADPSNAVNIIGFRCARDTSP
jgi:formylglycine-generating enzyme required for sulfatase activity